MAPRTYSASPSSGAQITLADLRELVEDTSGLPADALVHGQPSLRDMDATNPAGFRLRGLSVVFERGPRPTGQVTDG